MHTKTTFILVLSLVSCLTQQSLNAAELKEQALAASQAPWGIKSLRGKISPEMVAEFDALLTEEYCAKFQKSCDQNVERLLKALKIVPENLEDWLEREHALVGYSKTLLDCLVLTGVGTARGLCEQKNEIDTLREENAGLKAALIAAGALPQPLSESRALVVSAKPSASASPNKALITLTQRAHAKNGAANPTIKSAPLLLTYTAKQKSGWCSKLCGSKYTKE